jgi:hypothetical protein
MARLDQERQQKLEPKRMNTAVESITNLGFKIDSINYKDSNTLESEEIPNKLEVWNNRQHTGVLELSNSVTSNYTEDIILGKYSDKIEGVYMYNNMHDYVLDSGSQFLTEGLIQNPNSNVSLNKDWTKIERLNNNWFIYRLSVDDDRINNKFIYKGVLFNFNTSIR